MPLVPIESRSEEQALAEVGGAWDLSGRFPVPTDRLKFPGLRKGDHYEFHSFVFSNPGARDFSHGADHFCKVTLRSLADGRLAVYHLPVPESMFAFHGAGYVPGIQANGDL